MVEALTTRTRLLVVRETHEDEGGVEFRFQQGSHGRLDLREANSATYLRLARRSQERQHPVGVIFGEGDTITELIRADNDVPVQVWEKDPDRVQVHFQGHDGVFCLKRDHPEFTRMFVEETGTTGKRGHGARLVASSKEKAAPKRAVSRFSRHCPPSPCPDLCTSTLQVEKGLRIIH
jgi:hypothetical protein